MTVDQAYEWLYRGVLLALTACCCLCLLRAIAGPRIADRLVAVNMIGTQVIVCLAVLSVLFSESWLADVCVIYAMLSFVGVIVLTKVYMGVHAAQKSRKSARNGRNAG